MEQYLKVNTKDIFNKISDRWFDISAQLFKTKNELQTVLGQERLSLYMPYINEQEEAIKRALQDIKKCAEEPKITLAVTGTTSSGKSTLLNVLIGEELLPSAVQEMSAGIVEIRHDPKIRRLVIPNTYGSTWEVGEWNDPSAEFIEERLRLTMEQFREVESKAENPQDIEAVRFEIIWPTRIGNSLERFGLPSRSNISLIDLPGLKSVNDALNGDVIKNNINDALSLVVYNAAETDTNKQQDLLKQVIEQVKALGSTPGRMLFIANRIDMLKNDKNAQESEDKLLQNLLKQLKESLNTSLPIYKNDIKDIKIIPFSSEPALCALSIKSIGRLSKKEEYFLKKIDGPYRAIFPEDILDEWESLPRNILKWDGDNLSNLLSNTLQYARLHSFEDALQSHITENLPEIIIPGVVDKIYKAVFDYIFALQTCLEAYEYNSREDIEIKKGKLDEGYRVLGKQKENIVSILKPLADCIQIENNTALKNLFFNLLKPIEDIGNAVGDPRILTPILQFQKNIIEKPISDIFEYCEENSKFNHCSIPMIDAAPNKGNFQKIIHQLKNSPYGQFWDMNSNEVKQLRNDDIDNTTILFKQFVIELSNTWQYVIENEARNQISTIRKAFQQCSNKLIDKLSRDVIVENENFLDDFEALKNIFYGDVNIPDFKCPEINLTFEANVETTIEHVEVIKEFQQRRWYTLFLIQHKTQQIVEEEQEVRILNVSNFTDTFNQIIYDLSHKTMDNLIREILQFVGQIIKNFNDTLQERLDKGHKRYLDVLSYRMDELDQDFKQKIQGLSHLKLNVSDYQMALEDYRSWRNFIHNEEGDY